MNLHAFRHCPDSGDCYPLDGRTLRVTLKTARGDADGVCVLWNNKYEFCKRRSSTKMRLLCSDELYDYFVAVIPLKDVRFAYIFLIESGGKKYYFSEEGVVAEYDFSRGYYTFFQYPYINEADVVKPFSWAREAVFYQIFIDRFCRGNFTKDGSYITWRAGDKIRPETFAGGDLKGVALKLDYLKSMGINALYLSPVCLSPSNHKYNVRSYSEIDPQFGGERDLEVLLSAAHARGMRVVLDAVFNHCDESEEKFLDVKRRGRASPYYDWFIIHGDLPAAESAKRCNYEIFADCVYMPKWNTSHPAVRRYLISVALGYLRRGFDGLRLDVADEVSHTMWRELRSAVKAEFPEAALIGEVWHESRSYLGGDQLDGVMNYKLQKVFLDFFAEGGADACEAASRINRCLQAQPRAVNEMCLNFLDDHDTPRFLHSCGGDGEKLLRALAALFFLPGMPCVYYGTELPLTGGGDPDCRRVFDWEREPRYAPAIRSLVKMRGQLPCGEAYAYVEEGLVLVREDETSRVKAYFGCGARAEGETLYEEGDVKIVKEYYEQATLIG